MSATGQDCVYVTRDWGLHDDRWLAALRELGFDPSAISLRPAGEHHPTSPLPEVADWNGPFMKGPFQSATSLDQLRELVNERSVEGQPVLAGPLDTMTRHLVGLPTRLVGLSWGYDLHDLDASGQDLAWLRDLDGLVVDSDATAEIAKKHGVDPARITLLPWGVDLDVFEPDGATTDPAELGLPADARIVLSLRAHEPLYRVGDVITGFASVATDVPDAHLLVGHRGSLTDALKQQAVELGVADRVHFVGTLPEESLPALMRAAACYVTAAEVDGTSVTLLQAMACGTPAVASDSAGNRGWVRHGMTGRLFAVGDAIALGHAIRATLIEDNTALTANALADVQARANWHTNVPRLAGALRPLTSAH